MTRRSALKWLHWLSLALIVYFYLVEPEENSATPRLALATHAGVGLILALVVLIWTAIYLRKGLAGRAGPKLPGWAKRFHGLNHRVLQIGLPIMVATGALAGMLAPFAIRAFGVVPINPAVGSRTLHELAEDLHEIAFDTLLVAIVLHGIFHLWRHFMLKDNALRIMVPKLLHKYL
ncbi:cytochrome b [Phaeobacter inhibens]|uniref:cytochrome b n=1 Tax=Phaeobacter inhibens TaxID=221822 RepID=UPI00076BBAB2|nr:cytochrome b/b6 domain-containing protein [Phaeobacter inhibens]KXF90874.1 cytochrome B [Phaeobacter inhibens]WHP67280.1 cytochrome b/b6 domain-containing protein [Phaeobacter inhibens]